LQFTTTKEDQDMRPTFVDDGNDDSTELKCPSCGESNLHHERVEVFYRIEDAPTGSRAVVDAGKVSMDTDITGNPSERRDGLSIHFRCEHCPAKPIFHVLQHKGSTYVEFA
jgi:hypothetical protein